MLWKQLQTTYINEPCIKQLGSWDVKQYLKEKMREEVSYRDILHLKIVWLPTHNQSLDGKGKIRLIIIMFMIIETKYQWNFKDEGKT